MNITFDQLQQAVEFYFLPMANDFKFTHKKMNQNGFDTMVCFLEKDGSRYELSAQLEDEYVNVHLSKIIDHKPYDLGFVNYLNSLTETVVALNFFTRLYL